MSGSLADQLAFARGLRPAQVAHRARLRVQREVQRRLPGPARRLLTRPVGAPPPGWPGGFRPLALLDADLDEAHAAGSGHFDLLGEARALGSPIDWRVDGTSRLWAFHLHYLEWAWGLVDDPDRERASASFEAMWCSWKAVVPFGAGDAWAPYVVAVRTWVLCGLADALLDDEARHRTGIVADLALHAGYVRANLELDVGGNHLVKDLKAVIGAGVWLGDDRLVAAGLRHLRGQLDHQVLADGGHFERSPAYHVQVLADLVDVEGVLPSPPAWLTSRTAAMRGWLAAMVLPSGNIPLLGDAVPVAPGLLAALAPARTVPGLDDLLPSGHVVAEMGLRGHLVVDVGPPGPRDLPAHAHADCLSFVLCVDGRDVFVDGGTSTYDPGPRRAFERSTAAHNTVEVDGADQTPLFGTFRAGAPAVPHVEELRPVEGGFVLRAWHDGYERLPGAPRHERTITAGPDGLVLDDEVHGSGRHRVTSRLHVAPGLDVVPVPGGLRVGPVLVRWPADEPAWVPGSVEVGVGFGRRVEVPVLVRDAQVTLPARTSTTMGLVADGDT
ncbi:MAG: Heparinase family protein [Actinomycetia bacterium]|nr:Heparinase family protein [Actinomycetes bacterium]